MTDVTHDATQFNDISHFSAAIAQRMADAMARKQYRVTDLQENQEMMRQELRRGASVVRGYFDECP